MFNSRAQTGNRTGRGAENETERKDGGTNCLIDIHEAVKHLREGRQGMVQTRDQYIFIHQAVAVAVDYIQTKRLKSDTPTPQSQYYNII